MLPLSLLRAAVGHPMFVELKNGETYNGHLVNSDAWMNMNIRDVICTSRDGDRFWQMTECYIRGNTIKYLRVPEEVRCAFQYSSHINVYSASLSVLLDDDVHRDIHTFIVCVRW